MRRKTGIEWTEVTWNPTTGCDRISTGCDNCYAWRWRNASRPWAPTATKPMGTRAHPDRVLH